MKVRVYSVLEISKQLTDNLRNVIWVANQVKQIQCSFSDGNIRMVKVGQNFLKVTWQVVSYCQPTHWFKTEIPEVSSGTADEHDQDICHNCHQLFLQVMVIVDDNVDDFKQQAILNVVFIENFRSICFFEYFCDNLWNQWKCALILRWGPQLQSFV